MDHLGVALPVVTLLAAAAGGDFAGPGSAAAFVAQQVGGGVLTGVLLGWAGARVVVRAADAGWMPPNAQQIATLACGAGAWGVASSLGGNGFVAAFTAGLAFGAVANEHAGRMAEFAEEEGELLTLVTFLLVGAALVGPAIAAADPARWLLVLLALTVVRIVPTSLSLLGTGLAWPSHLFLGWFGPRGLATVVFGVLVVEQGGVPGADVVLEVASLAVFVSAVARGITAAPLADRYGTWTRCRPEGASEHVAMPELHPRRWMRGGRA